MRKTVNASLRIESESKVDEKANEQQIWNELIALEKCSLELLQQLYPQTSDYAKASNVNQLIRSKSSMMQLLKQYAEQFLE